MSSQLTGAEIDLGAVDGAGQPDAGIEHGARLVAFTEAVMLGKEQRLQHERAALRAVLSDACFVDTCAVIAAFNVVDRIANATGIPLDEMMEEMSRPVRQQLNLNRFASAVNTPGAR